MKWKTLTHMTCEVKELRETRHSIAELRGGAHQDAFSQDGEDNLDSELWESQSTANKLPHQMKEPQEVISSMSASQDFKDLETACSSVSSHVPGKPTLDAY